MYTAQQTAKPLSAYDSYIQQNLATREALRVRPHAHTPKNEPLPPTAGLEGVVHDTIPQHSPETPIVQPVACKSKPTKKAAHMPGDVMPIVAKTISIPKNTIPIASCTPAVTAKAEFLMPLNPPSGVDCRGGPA